MKCNVAWNREFIDENLSKTFRTNDLKKHREYVLLDREKSLLPATMPSVEVELNRRKISEELDVISKKKQELHTQMQGLEREAAEKRRELYMLHDTSFVIKVEQKVFQRSCPNTECRGYLSNWTCGLCKVVVCSKCHAVKSGEAEHMCKEDEVATAALLEKDTKYCPNASCRAPIFKIDGCSQIFCTMCNTAFDWKTGQIETNQARIHNPHFYEWLRLQNNGIIPRNIGDVPCGGLPTIWSINNTIRRKRFDINIDTIYRGINHIAHYEIPTHPINLMGGDVFLRLRVRYLLKEISEDQWKRELQKIEKKNEKNIAFRHIFDMIVAIAIDMFNRIVSASTEDEAKVILTELDELRKYFNASVAKLSKRFTTSMPKGLNEHWIYTYVH